MNYISLLTTPDEVLFRGVSSQSDDYVLPDNAVNCADLVIPSAVFNLGITDWQTFSSSGLLRFYKLEPGNILTLRTLARWYYTIPSGQLFATFAQSAGSTVVAENAQTVVFITSEYPGQEEPPLVCYAAYDGEIGRAHV